MHLHTLGKGLNYKDGKYCVLMSALILKFIVCSKAPTSRYCLLSLLIRNTIMVWNVSLSITLWCASYFSFPGIRLSLGIRADDLSIYQLGSKNMVTVKCRSSWMIADKQIILCACITYFCYLFTGVYGFSLSAYAVQLQTAKSDQELAGVAGEWFMRII